MSSVSRTLATVAVVCAVLITLSAPASAHAADPAPAMVTDGPNLATDIDLLARLEPIDIAWTPGAPGTQVEWCLTRFVWDGSASGECWLSNNARAVNAEPGHVRVSHPLNDGQWYACVRTVSPVNDVLFPPPSTCSDGFVLDTTRPHSPGAVQIEAHTTSRTSAGALFNNAIPPPNAAIEDSNLSTKWCVNVRTDCVSPLWTGIFHSSFLLQGMSGPPLPFVPLYVCAVYVDSAGHESLVPSCSKAFSVRRLELREGRVAPRKFAARSLVRLNPLWIRAWMTRNATFDVHIEESRQGIRRNGRCRVVVAPARPAARPCVIWKRALPPRTRFASKYVRVAIAHWEANKLLPGSYRARIEARDLDEASSMSIPFVITPRRK